MVLLHNRPKSCEELLNSGLFLKVWGVLTSRESLSEIFGENHYWKKWGSINDYCFYIVSLRQYGKSARIDEEHCQELRKILEEKMKALKLTTKISDIIPQSPECRRILSLERAIITLKGKEFKPLNNRSKEEKIEDIKRTLKFLKKTGALSDSND